MVCGKRNTLRKQEEEVTHWILLLPYGCREQRIPDSMFQ